MTDNKPLLGLLGQAGRVRKKQQEMKQKHDQHARSRTLYAGDPVWVKHHLEEPRWLGGVIESRLGPLSYEIILMDGRVMRRHQDNVILRETGSKAQEKLNNPQFPCPPPMPLPNVSATTYMDPHTESRNHEEKSSEEGLPSPEPHTDSRNQEDKSSEDALHSPKPPNKNQPTGVRRSTRPRKPIVGFIKELMQRQKSLSSYQVVF